MNSAIAIMLLGVIAIFAVPAAAQPGDNCDGDETMHTQLACLSGSFQTLLHQMKGFDTLRDFGLFKNIQQMVRNLNNSIEGLGSNPTSVQINLLRTQIEGIKELIEDVREHISYIDVDDIARRLRDFKMNGQKSLTEVDDVLREMESKLPGGTSPP